MTRRKTKMCTIIYDQEDKFAGRVAAALRELEAGRKQSVFGASQVIVRERVWEGEVKVADASDGRKRYPLRLIGVSVGPDYANLLKACGVNSWTEVLRIRTWKSGANVPVPSGLLRFSGSGPAVAWLRDMAEFWRAETADKWADKLSADVRRIALQIVDTVLVKGRMKFVSPPPVPICPIPTLPIRRPKNREMYLARQ